MYALFVIESMYKTSSFLKVIDIIKSIFAFALFIAVFKLSVMYAVTATQSTGGYRILSPSFFFDEINKI